MLEILAESQIYISMGQRPMKISRYFFALKGQEIKLPFQGEFIVFISIGRCPMLWSLCLSGYY